MIKTLKLKLPIMLEFLNTKIFSLKDIHQIGLKKFLLLVKFKILKKKIIKRKGDKLCVKWKGYDNSFNS